MRVGNFITCDSGITSCIRQIVENHIEAPCIETSAAVEHNLIEILYSVGAYDSLNGVRIDFILERISITPVLNESGNDCNTVMIAVNSIRCYYILNAAC